MQSSFKGFLLGLGVSVVLVGSFFAGAIADRVFVLKPLDFIFDPSRKEAISTRQKTSDHSEPPTVLTADERSIVEVTDQASESVVTIAVKRKVSERILFDDFIFSPKMPRDVTESQPLKQDIGSGFVLTADGLVVTNKHVVNSEAEYFVIDRQNKEYQVTKIYRDPVNDLAILKVSNLGSKAIQLGNSDQLKVGQQVIAIGTALGEFRHTVTTGVVSGLGRGIEAGDPFNSSVESLENVIQTDAAINPGNSGGPLLDSNGRVIGVNVAVSAAGQNIGFAIPINVIKESLENFNQTGKFDRPFFGVRYRVIPESLARRNQVPMGAFVFEVIPGSAASAAGLKPEDIITEFDGKSLGETEIGVLMKNKKVGDKVRVKYWRDGEEKEVESALTLDTQS